MLIWCNVCPQCRPNQSVLTRKSRFDRRLQFKFVKWLEVSRKYLILKDIQIRSSNNIRLVWTRSVQSDALPQAPILLENHLRLISPAAPLTSSATSCLMHHMIPRTPGSPYILLYWGGWPSKFEAIYKGIRGSSTDLMQQGIQLNVLHLMPNQLITYFLPWSMDGWIANEIELLRSSRKSSCKMQGMLDHGLDQLQNQIPFLCFLIVSFAVLQVLLLQRIRSPCRFREEKAFRTDRYSPSGFKPDRRLRAFVGILPRPATYPNQQSLGEDLEIHTQQFHMFPSLVPRHDIIPSSSSWSAQGKAADLIDRT